MEKQTTVIRSNAMEVRAILFDGKTLFSMCDIIKACGKKNPADWYNKAKRRDSKLKAVKLTYPTGLESGPKVVNMWFVDVSCGKRLLKLAGCTSDVRKWFEQEVFPYTFPGAEPKSLAVKEATGLQKQSAMNIDAMCEEMCEAVFQVLRLSGRILKAVSMIEEGS